MAVQWLTAEAAAVKKNIQFCSVHWLCCSKLMMKKRKTEEMKKMVVHPWIAWGQQFGTFHALMKEIKVEDPRAFANFVWKDVHQFQYLLDTG